MRCLIYTLSDPRTGEVRYVGMTSRTVEERLREHLKDTRRASVRRHSTNWVRSLFAEGCEPLVAVIEETTSEQWAERERHWIAKYRADGCALTNLTDGGEGVLGHRHDEAARAKIREKRAQQEFTPETRARLSKAHRGNQNARGNKIVRTPEHQAKLVDARHANGSYDPSPEAREKMAAAAKRTRNRLGTIQSPEARAKISAAKKGQTPWMKGRRHSPETRAKMRAAWERRRQTEGAPS